MFSIITLILIISLEFINCDRGLIWSDEFNGNDLDLDNWHVRGNDDICESKFRDNFFLLNYLTIQVMFKNNSVRLERAVTLGKTTKLQMEL